MTIDRDALRKLIEAQPNAWRLNVTALVDEIAHLAAASDGGEVEYAHEYTDEGGGKHRRKVSATEFAERRPDGHRADGSPYWNYTQKRRRKAGRWEEAPSE